MAKRILIVEDADDISETMKELLETEGYEVACVANGLEALRHLESTKALPNLILLDLMMPQMDGYAFREEQTKHPNLASIPVLVMTAATDPQAKVKKLGAQGMLKKPFKDIATILDGIERFFDGASPTHPIS
jgi:two-component system chemotaxis response regulator CheY